MFRPQLYCAIAVALVLSPAVTAQDQPETDAPAPTGGRASRVPDALRSTLDALGASSGVPDGFGHSWYPSVSVRGQRAQMALSNFQFGATVPFYTTDDDLVFGNGSVRALDFRSNARLPTDRVRFPRALWDAQAGGGYVGQLGSGWSWGTTLNFGTASDRPFNSLAEATISALAFLRAPARDQNAWLFYVVSTSNGQLGRNIPVPGVAYEYHTDRLTTIIGFPFVSIDYHPYRKIQLELIYAALTDLQARASYHATDEARVFTGFEWANQSWFRAKRADHRDQLFLYEKRLEGGVGYRIYQQLDFQLVAGYAFDRFFVENRGLSFRGRNRTDLAPGQFISGQLEFKY